MLEAVDETDTVTFYVTNVYVYVTNMYLYVNVTNIYLYLYVYVTNTCVAYICNVCVELYALVHE